MTVAGDDAGEVADLAALAWGDATPGVLWSHAGADLNANLVSLTPDAGVSAHVNGEVDIILVGVVGAGVVEIDGQAHDLGEGQALVIPKGVRRAIAATTERFAYLSCHRRRGGLWPAGRPGPGEPPR